VLGGGLSATPLGKNNKGQIDEKNSTIIHYGSSHTINGGKMLCNKSLVYLSMTLFLAIVFCYGCSDSLNPENNSQNNPIPLKKGNSWNYILTSYDSTETISYTENNVENVITDTVISNIRWYSLNSSPKGVWFTNKSDGYWGYVKATNQNKLIKDTTFLVYKYPTVVGDKYRDYEVVSVDEEVIVPAGKFNCIHIIIRYPDSKNYLLDSFETFFKPGLGKVKWMQIGKKAGNKKYVVYKSELSNYSLK
jgi:hypothetical protein